MAYSKSIKFKDIEKEIIELLKYGYTNAKIAEILHVSSHTVKLLCSIYY